MIQKYLIENKISRKWQQNLFIENTIGSRKSSSLQRGFRCKKLYFIRKSAVCFKKRCLLQISVNYKIYQFKCLNFGYLSGRNILKYCFTKVMQTIKTKNFSNIQLHISRNIHKDKKNTNQHTIKKYLKKLKLYLSNSKIENYLRISFDKYQSFRKRFAITYSSLYADTK